LGSGHGGQRLADDVLAANAGELETVLADGLGVRRAGDERDFHAGQRQRGAEYRAQPTGTKNCHSHCHLLQ